MVFSYVDKDWDVNPKKRATHGVAQAALARICGNSGFEKGYTLHSPRNWFSTCAGQLLYTREHREKLGRWAPGSVMPDHYDKAVCATELRLRSEITQRINNGWRPSKEYEIPDIALSAVKTEMDLGGKSSSDAESTSVLSSDLDADEDITKHDG